MLGEFIRSTAYCGAVVRATRMKVRKESSWRALLLAMNAAYRSVYGWCNGDGLGNAVLPVLLVAPLGDTFDPVPLHAPACDKLCRFTQLSRYFHQTTGGPTPMSRYAQNALKRPARVQAVINSDYLIPIPTGSINGWVYWAEILWICSIMP